ncbi:MAG: hypothetical protein MUO40_08360 [Anaerolineaceae bacterium]|nr:hypothetical protein [Anaerolineaceae bacterium]
MQNIQMLIGTIVRFLHDLFTATWIGGLLVLSLAVLPGLKKDPQVKKPKLAIRAIQKRMRTLALISMLGLAVTGILMSQYQPGFTGFFSFTSTGMTLLSIKHILMILMVALAFSRLAVNRKEEKQKSSRLEKISEGILFGNTFLGVVVLFLSAYLSIGIQ